MRLSLPALIAACSASTALSLVGVYWYTGPWFSAVGDTHLHVRWPDSRLPSPDVSAPRLRMDVPLSFLGLSELSESQKFSLLQGFGLLLSLPSSAEQAKLMAPTPLVLDGGPNDYRVKANALVVAMRHDQPLPEDWATSRLNGAVLQAPRSSRGLSQYSEGAGRTGTDTFGRNTPGVPDASVAFVCSGDGLCSGTTSYKGYRVTVDQIPVRWMHDWDSLNGYIRGTLNSFSR